MDINMITNQEKIKALLDGEVKQVMQREQSHNTHEFFSGISLDDVLKYFNDHGIGQSLYLHEEGAMDGYYLLKNKDAFVIYRQEHGMKIWEEKASTEIEAVHILLRRVAYSFGIH